MKCIAQNQLLNDVYRESQTFTFVSIFIINFCTRERKLVLPTTMFSTDTADIKQTISWSCIVSTNYDFHMWIQHAISVSFPINTSIHKSRTLYSRHYSRGLPRFRTYTMTYHDNWGYVHKQNIQETWFGITVNLFRTLINFFHKWHSPFRSTYTVKLKKILYFQREHRHTMRLFVNFQANLRVFLERSYISVNKSRLALNNDVSHFDNKSV